MKTHRKLLTGLLIALMTTFAHAYTNDSEDWVEVHYDAALRYCLLGGYEYENDYYDQTVIVAPGDSVDLEETAWALDGYDPDTRSDASVNVTDVVTL